MNKDTKEEAQSFQKCWYCNGSGDIEIENNGPVFTCHICNGTGKLYTEMIMSKDVKRFKHWCTCGGHAWRMNGRDPKQPHMAWCPQLEEYAEWYKLEQDIAKEEILWNR